MAHFGAPRVGLWAVAGPQQRGESAFGSAQNAGLLISLRLKVIRLLGHRKGFVDIIFVGTSCAGVLAAI